MDLVWLLLVMGGGDGDIWLSIMVDLVYGWCIGGVELWWWWNEGEVRRWLRHVEVGLLGRKLIRRRLGVSLYRKLGLLII